MKTMGIEGETSPHSTLRHCHPTVMMILDGFTLEWSSNDEVTTDGV